MKQTEISESLHRLMHEEGYCTICQQAQGIEQGAAIFLAIAFVVGVIVFMIMR